MLSLFRLRSVCAMTLMLAVMVAGEESNYYTVVEAHQQSADTAESVRDASSNQRSYDVVSVQCPTGAVCDDPDRRPLQLGSYEDDCPSGYGMTIKHTDTYDGQKTKTVCFPCKSGFFSKGAVYPCQPCGPGDGFGSPNGAGHQDHCFCLPGFGGPSCTQCLPGTFSPGGSLAPCCSCPNKANTKAGATSEEACGCQPGRGGAACDLCPLNTFGLGGTIVDGSANRECTTCPGAVGSTTTLQVGSKSQAACVCAKGFAGPSCTACTTDQICPGGSRDPPLRCPGGAASTPAANAVTLADCTCNAGYGRVDPKTTCDGCGLCERCPPGSYSAGGFGACIKCQLGFTSPAGSVASTGCSLCPAGTYEKGGVCLNCPFGTTSISAAATPPISEAACNIRQCPAGFGTQPCKGRTSGSCIECAPCPEGTYRSGTGFAPCTACASGSTSLVGSTDVTACTPCLGGTYEENGKCLRCPLGSNSNAGGRGVESCSICLAGFGLQPCPGKSGCMSCQACPEGTYQDAATPGFGSLATCKPCAAGKTSAAGAKSAADCFCKFPGYGSGDGGAICLLCPVGTFAVGPITGPAQGCNACPTGKTTLQPGAGDLSDCVCKAGFGWNALTSFCEPCSYPKYQGHLDSNLVPVTSATKDNPHPVCLQCNLTPGWVLGNANRQCVLSTGSTLNPAVYCANQNNPLGTPFCPDPTFNCPNTAPQLACA